MTVLLYLVILGLTISIFTAMFTSMLLKVKMEAAYSKQFSLLQAERDWYEIRLRLALGIEKEN